MLKKRPKICGTPSSRLLLYNCQYTQHSIAPLVTCQFCFRANEIVNRAHEMQKNTKKMIACHQSCSVQNKYLIFFRCGCKGFNIYIYILFCYFFVKQLCICNCCRTRSKKNEYYFLIGMHTCIFLSQHRN